MFDLRPGLLAVKSWNFRAAGCVTCVKTENPMQRNPERGGILAAILILLAILACGVFLVVSTGYVFIRNVAVTKSKGETRVETPIGTLRVKESSRFDSKTFGVPLYPGAQRNEDLHKPARVELDFGESHRGLTVTAAEYVTPDSLSQVEDYYRSRLPEASIKHNRHQHLIFEFHEGGMKKLVVLREQHPGTRIALASIGEPAAN
jgi:hypothetical protein